FHPRKIITTGEGGMITTNNRMINQLCRALRSHGQAVSDLKRHSRGLKKLPAYKLLGYNYRMSDILAAVGISQMRNLKKLLRIRQQKAKNYHSGLSDIPDLILPKADDMCRHTYQSYVVIQTNGAARNKESLGGILRRNNIPTCPGTHSVPHTELYRRQFGFTQKDYPHSRFAEQNSYTLPLYPELSRSDQYMIVNTIRKYFGKKPVRHS
ncbi:MAG: DegT/DnrJ/EryC1/StrS family aminotransferase, partial [Elusimicrobia bacterium]|nr:DegT/DnrJ/EryC1/StrS family aminotransferase [Elusimicrobiota bacterium]MBD3412611.1 DegT/DnrJ/EryC1/StrS family aminotransferase [Elusimicrobiota bacterium]